MHVCPHTRSHARTVTPRTKNRFEQLSPAPTRLRVATETLSHLRQLHGTFQSDIDSSIDRHLGRGKVVTWRGPASMRQLLKPLPPDAKHLPSQVSFLKVLFSFRLFKQLTRF